jgi:hypothetical protein
MQKKTSYLIWISDNPTSDYPTVYNRKSDYRKSEIGLSDHRKSKNLIKPFFIFIVIVKRINKY